MAQVAGFRSGYSFPIKSYVHVPATTTTATTTTATATTVTTINVTTAQATTAALSSAKDDDDFDRNMAIVGVAAMALFLLCLIGYMCGRVKDMKEMIIISAKNPPMDGNAAAPSKHDQIEQELLETNNNIRMLEAQQTHYASLNPAPPQSIGTPSEPTSPALTVSLVCPRGTSIAPPALLSN